MKRPLVRSKKARYYEKSFNKNYVHLTANAVHIGQVLFLDCLRNKRELEMNIPCNGVRRKIMCPYFDQSKQVCKVTPYDSNAKRDDSWKNHYCMNSSNCKTCGNYEAVRRGDYKIER